MALRDAHVSPFNLVTVSSIMPPQAKIVSREEGLSELHAGEIVFCVMARGETNTEGEAVEECGSPLSAYRGVGYLG